MQLRLAKGAFGIARASAELALARGSVKKLIRAGRLAGRVAAAGKRCFTSIPPNAVEAYRSLRTASLTTRVVRLEFGLSRDRFRELCHAGILPVLEGRDQTEQAVWRIDRHRLDVLKRQLDDAASASPTEATENVISLATACRTRLIEGELALTLSAILDGRLPVIGRLKGLAVIPSLVVDADRHLELRDEWRTEQSNTLSIVEVAEQMAVKQEVAYHLVPGPAADRHRCDAPSQPARGDAAASGVQNRVRLASRPCPWCPHLTQNREDTAIHRALKSSL